jgi:transposase
LFEEAEVGGGIEDELRKSNRHWLEVHQLPPYSPELNPTERLWQHTPKIGTHKRFFGGVDALLATLTRVFGEMQSHPELIHSRCNGGRHSPRLLLHPLNSMVSNYGQHSRAWPPMMDSA